MFCIQCNKHMFMINCWINSNTIKRDFSFQLCLLLCGPCSSNASTRVTPHDRRCMLGNVVPSLASLRVPGRAPERRKNYGLTAGRYGDDSSGSSPGQHAGRPVGAAPVPV